MIKLRSYVNLPSRILEKVKYVSKLNDHNSLQLSYTTSYVRTFEDLIYLRINFLPFTNTILFPLCALTFCNLWHKRNVAISPSFAAWIREEHNNHIETQAKKGHKIRTRSNQPYCIGKSTGSVHYWWRVTNYIPSYQPWIKDVTYWISQNQIMID